MLRVAIFLYLANYGQGWYWMRGEPNLFPLKFSCQFQKEQESERGHKEFQV